MKNIFILASCLFLTMTMQAQDRPQPTQGPAPIINVKKPETFTLPNGLKVLVVEDHKLPRVSYNLSLDNAPYAEGDKKGVADLLSALIGNGTKKTPKDAFNDEVDFLGANIRFSSNGASASSLSKYSQRVLELMAEGTLMPNFTQEELDKARAKMLESLRSQEKNVGTVVDRVRDVLAYGKNHPSGEYVSETTLNNVKLSDVNENYTTYFVPGNAYLVVIGDVNFKDVKKNVTKLFGSWTKAVAPKQSYNDPQNVQFTQINFVDMPNAVQSEISVLNTVNLQMKDADYFPAIVANQVFGGDFNSYLNMNLREAHGWTYGAGSVIGGSRYVGTFLSSSQVRNAVTDSAVVEFVKELKRIRTDMVTPEELANVKAGYVGKFVMQVSKPQTVARFALNIETEGLPEDFYRNFIKNINAVTAEDVNRVAKKYFLAENSRIVVVGKASEILPGLEKLNIPIFYFDPYGNPTTKPVVSKPIPAGVTPKSVIENYIKAIGGQKAVSGVKTVFITASATIPQAPAPLVLVTKKDNSRTLNNVSLSGMAELSKQVVGATSGYTENQGVRKDLTAEEFSEKKAHAGTFEELSLLKSNDISLEKIEVVNGKDAYVVKNGKTTTYYDVATGLKVMESKMSTREGQDVTVSTLFDDYRDVKGVKFPYKVTMNQGIEIDFVVSDIKINEGVSDADFQ